MTFIYMIFKILTFPGTFIKGFWEHFICKNLGLPVESSTYFSTNELCGHVDHALAKKPLAAFILAAAPSLLNLFSGAVFFKAGYTLVFDIGITYVESKLAFVSGIFLIYLGVSFLCNVFPLVEDAMNLYDILYVQKKGNTFGRIIAFVPTAILYAGAYLERYCVTSILGVAFVVVVSVMAKYA